uniref:Uncharacterized protein n=1 Tax=viral metagenome TaxID=1070528 RepID=A0A6C0BZI6_9ZZZZ
MATAASNKKQQAVPKIAAKKRKHAAVNTSSSASSAKVKLTEVPVAAVRHLFTCSFQRVVWLGNRDEVGESNYMSNAEKKASLEDDLKDYILRMQHRSPLCWFQESESTMQWHHCVASPVEVIIEAAKLANCSVDETCRRLVNLESVTCLVEHALVATFRDADTCGVCVKDRLLHAARKCLFDLLPENTAISWSIVEPHLDSVENDAYNLLSHVRDKSGVLYSCTGMRGIMDRRLHTILTKRTNFYVAPTHWKAAGTFTVEQAAVFVSVMEHLRARGWSVLSGPGGSGKTHMLRHIADLCESTEVFSEGDGPDCPACGEERLVRRCNICGYHRHDQGQRELRVCFLGPTNRAVAVLVSAIKGPGRVFSHLMGTVHSLTRRRDLPPQDLVVIDESSMLAAEHGDLLMKTEAFRKAAWLLVGDHVQLLPVGRGELFRPLKLSSQLPSLSINMRANNVSLAAVIDAVRNANSATVLPYEQHSSSTHELYENIRNAKCDLVLAVRNEERVHFNAFCIQSLPCTHAGLSALDDYRKIAVEDTLTGKNMPRSFIPYAGMPVRFQTNVHKPTACRGDIGRIKGAQQVSKTWNIQVEVNNSIVRFASPFFGIPEHIRPAFATTLHDAQGAQSSKVGIVLPPSVRCPLLTLETLYTAISRAQDDLILFTRGCRLRDILAELSSCTRLRTTPLNILLAGDRGLEG